ncbi:helix-turn-helix domain-containing protein [Micromonospora sp. NPDC052213]|uniref:helix-turn-helix domain-containing protein n=1 Tax=Micromonospora sp. NPDC052213 TaxID=3155812 RepID=UPI003437167A
MDQLHAGSLEALGLRPDEARVYAAVAPARTVSRTDLYSVVGLPSPEVETALSGLVAAGLLAVDDDEPDAVTAAPPDLAGEVLLLRRLRELHEARAVLQQLALGYRTAPRQRDQSDIVEFIPGHAVTQRFEQIQRRARDEVMIIDAPPYLDPVPINHTQETQLAAGVRYRTIYDRRGLEDHGGLEQARRYVALGEQARMLDRAPTKLAIVDREYALMPVSHDQLATRDGMVLIYQSPLLDTLVAYFDMLWLHALPLETSGDATLSDEDAVLLTLLLTGFTDEAIARQLGLGRRTVVRRVKALMDRAGVASRMQLGWQAGQLGWVTASWRANGSRLPGTSAPKGDAE